MTLTSPRTTPAHGIVTPLRVALSKPLAPYYLVLGSTILLTALGLVMVLSASSVESYAASGSSWAIAQRQAMWVVIGVPALLVASRLPTAWYRRLSLPFLVIALVLLVLVLVPGIGVSVNGNQNWIDIGGSIRIQPAEAANLYAAILQHEPQNVAAIAGLGGLYLEMGELDQARGMLAAVPAEKAGDPAVASLRAAIDLAEQAAKLGDPSALQQRIAQNPKDHDARFDLALIYNSMGQREEAADELLAIVQRDRKWRDDGARAQLVTFFEAWGPTDPATLYGRRRLSSLLFS